MYQSKMMTTDVGDDDCAICRFLDGDRSTVSMLAVIRALDIQLAQVERYNRELLIRLSESILNKQGAESVSLSGLPRMKPTIVDYDEEQGGGDSPDERSR